MTEEEWLSVRHSSELLKFVDQRQFGGRGQSRTRKLRLVRCAAFRLAWDQLPDDVFRQAVVVAERFADDDCSLSLLHDALREVEKTAHWLQSPYVEDGYRLLDSTAKRRATDYLLATAPVGLCDCVRDIFGNPFRPATLDPAWRTSTAVAIAKGMYESRDFGAMPILADALQDAGCDSDDILDHCRGPGPHVRGCWVVDLVLGKA
jgi:hypothetical protein